MRLTYIVTAFIVVCAAALGAIMIMGPKLGLQLPPIEQKAMAYLEKHHFIKKNEQIAGYKAMSIYDYSHAAVITDKRIFMYQDDTVHSIPLNKITMVSVKDSELGRQEVLISAQRDGMMMIELPHASVPQLINLLKVPSSIIKHNGEYVPTQSNPGKV